MSRRRSVAPLLSALVALVWLLGARPARAAVDLYTIGPGDSLFTRWGHSLVCLRDDAPSAGPARCFDYGIPDDDDPVHMAWASLRGERSFIPVAVDEPRALAFFRGQGRAIERQRLALSPAEADRLEALLERDVRERRAYAYHPYFANCTTQIRDRLDEATGGKLRAAAKSAPEGTKRFRDLAEEGLSGHLGELTALAFLLGSPSERRPTPWEAMFLPSALRDAAATQFSAPPERVEERKAVILPTSPSVGRAALLALAFALLVLVRWGARPLAGAEPGAALPKRTRVTLALAGLVLGGMALVADAVAALVVWPEFTHNWALAVLLPTDLALPWLGRRALAIYVKARLALAVAAVVLAFAGVIAQPMLPLAILVGLPMAGLGSALRDAARQRRTEPIVAAG